MGWVGLIVLILLVWTATSIAWLIIGLSRNPSPGKWYDWVFAPPVLVIANLISYYRKLSK